MTTRIDIIDQARAAIGERPLVTEDASGADVALAQFNTHIGALATLYPWSFQVRLLQLAQLTASPLPQWRYCYQLPADLIGVPVGVHSPRSTAGFAPASWASSQEALELEWERLGDKIYSSQPQLWMRYTYTLTPAQWPAYFTQLAVLTLQAWFALSVREEQPLFDRLIRLVYGPPEMGGMGGMVASAMSIDASSQPSRSVPAVSNPLIDVRMG